jgi:hypothetical protein
MSKQTGNHDLENASNFILTAYYSDLRYKKKKNAGTIIC